VFDLTSGSIWNTNGRMRLPCPSPSPNKIRRQRETLERSAAGRLDWGQPWLPMIAATGGIKGRCHA
jgi:hypothetical protein